MSDRDYRDLLGGALLILLGAFAAVYAWANYPIGNYRAMGPGMFPLWLGIILFGLGILVAAPALTRTGPKLPAFEFRPLIAISAAGLVFAFCIERFGIVPAVFALTIVSVLADTKLSRKGMILLAAGMAIGAMLIFKVALDLPVHIMRWPF